MRAVRFLTFALLLVAGLAGKASAQYSNAPGVFPDVKVGFVPAFAPAVSLPAGVSSIGPDLYSGTLTVVHNGDGTYSAQYQGERSDRAKINIVATFNSSWAGWKTSFLAVGSSVEEIISGIDGANLISANINAVGTVDHENHRVVAKISGTGAYPPEVSSFKVLKAPGFLR